MKSVECDLAGAGLRQHIARGERCTSSRQQERRTHQAQQKYPPQLSAKANEPFVANRHERAKPEEHYHSPDRNEGRMFPDILAKIKSLLSFQFGYEGEPNALDLRYFSGSYARIGDPLVAILGSSGEKSVRIAVASLRRDEQP